MYRSASRLGAALVVVLAAAAQGAEPPSWHLPIYDDGAGTTLVPFLSLKGAYFAQSGSWYGSSRRNLGRHSSEWVEGVASLGGDATLSLGDAGTLYGGLTGFYAGSALGTDAAGTNADQNGVSDTSLERYVVGWRSCTAIDGLDEDAIDLSVGKQTYQIGSGFLFWDAGSDGGERAAFYIGPYQSFERTAVARFSSFGVTANLAYLSPNDRPNTNTELWTSDLAYAREGLGNVGVGFSHIFKSDLETRDGMNVWSIRADLTPLATFEVLPGLNLKGEYAHEDNGDALRADGWYGEVGYDFSALAGWSPYLSYRYAAFSGDSPTAAATRGSTRCSTASATEAPGSRARFWASMSCSTRT